ncbi:hypothetical protein KFE98_20150 [bacterium SCSIO 12741]|nr:hypothetical protein KFE98_20150 [bacterium SCSIO 12741]
MESKSNNNTLSIAFVIVLMLVIGFEIALFLMQEQWASSSRRELTSNRMNHLKILERISDIKAENRTTLSLITHQGELIEERNLEIEKVKVEIFVLEEKIKKERENTAEYQKDILRLKKLLHSLDSSRQAVTNRYQQLVSEAESSPEYRQAQTIDRDMDAMKRAIDEVKDNKYDFKLERYSPRNKKGDETYNPRRVDKIIVSYYIEGCITTNETLYAQLFDPNGQAIATSAEDPLVLDNGDVMALKFEVEKSGRGQFRFTDLRLVQKGTYSVQVRNSKGISKGNMIVEIGK